MFLLTLSYIFYNQSEPKPLDLQTYTKYLNQNLFKSAVIDDNRLTLHTDKKSFLIPSNAINLEELMQKIPVEIDEGNDEWILFALTFLLFILIFSYLFNRFLNQKEEKSRVKLEKATEAGDFHSFISPIKSNIVLNDVAGMDDVKDEIKEIIDFLKEPGKYRDFGIKLPKGLLLVGPPGVGKTMLAKAISGESRLPFFYQSGASFVHLYVGMGAKRVRELFESAKKQMSAIIFIDEIDAVGKSRGGGNSEERDATLNQLLVEMDGFEDSSNIIVIGATNQIEILDEALLRPGRFDRRIYIPLPNISERKEILKLHLKDKKYDLDIDKLASISTGYSSATLATWVNETALSALKRGSNRLELTDFESVKEKVVSGKRREASLDEKEKQIQALYQASKIFCAYKIGLDFEKITLFQREFTEKKREFQSKSSLIDLLKLYLSGNEACKIFFNESYSNAKEDILKAKELSRRMVDEYGMGKSLLSNSIDIDHLLQFSKEEIASFVEDNKNKIEQISKILFQKEFITKKEIEEIAD
jgi:ATP-dependent metalloprotease FtsH